MKKDEKYCFVISNFYLFFRRFLKLFFPHTRSKNSFTSYLPWIAREIVEPHTAGSTSQAEEKSRNLVSSATTFINKSRGQTF